MISAVVICFNEEEKLSSCLSSVKGFTDELVVVDLGSSDNSVNVAKKFKSKVYHHKFVSFVELVRDYAVSKAKGDWILVLDPDEEITEQLKNKLKNIKKNNNVVAVNIPRKNIFFGKWIEHTNWWPDRHIRFFKKGVVSWSNKIHAYPKVDGTVYELPAKEELAIIHHGYKSISQFMDRQNRYSKIEAENLYSGGERFSWTKFLWKPTREFIVRFIRHGGFLDGFYGIALTILMMIYQLEVLVKLWELERNSKK